MRKGWRRSALRARMTCGRGTGRHRTSRDGTGACFEGRASTDRMTPRHALRKTAMQTTIDVTGLPEPVVNDIRQLVGTLRSRLSGNDGAHAPGETPEEWARRLT